MKLFKRFIKYYSPYRILFTVVLSCAFIVVVIELLFPMITKGFINDFIPNSKLDAIIFWAILLLVLYITRAILQYVIAYWGHVVGTRMEAENPQPKGKAKTPQRNRKWWAKQIAQCNANGQDGSQSPEWLGVPFHVSLPEESLRKMIVDNAG